MTRFIVVRHGETRWNLEERIQGHGDSGLTELGLAQAHAIARRLAGERFDRLVSSDLGRALQTAACIASRTGHAVVPDPRFRERSFGVAEGCTYAEMDLQFPHVFAHHRATDPDFRVPGGETRRELYERVHAGFEALARAHPGESIAVVCHGGVLGALYRRVHGIDPSVQARIPIPNASYNRVSFEEDRWSLEVWADTAHLADIGGDGAASRGSALARMS